MRRRFNPPLRQMLTLLSKDKGENIFRFTVRGEEGGKTCNIKEIVRLGETSKFY